MSIVSKLSTPPCFSSSNPNYNPRFPFSSSKSLTIRCAKRSKRTGKLRYPSEKKKLQLKTQDGVSVENKFEGLWRLSKLGVLVHNDPGKDFLGVSDALLQEIAKVLEFPVASMLPPEAFSVIRKSFDARKICSLSIVKRNLGMQKEPKFVYTVEMDVSRLLRLEPRTWDFIARLEPKVGLIEHMPHERVSGDLNSIIHDNRNIREATVSGEDGNENYSGGSCKFPTIEKPKVAVVGSGPSGLFAALVLAEFGADVTMIERGQAVEQRGRDIGALIVRQILQLESNFFFGEGGAGTWSDGKLVTRIGRNSSSVQAFMKTLVRFGAPESILIDGKPHLGTDRLIPLLRNFRQHLQEIGVTIRFGTRVDDLLVEDACVVGVNVSDSSESSQFSTQKLKYDAVVLAVGHSARDIYQMLLTHNVNIVPKDFSVGLRVEHPQELINCIQYSELADEVRSGRGKVPVADYKIVDFVDRDNTSGTIKCSCYSFCMCPGGQVVLTSTKPSELCINGISFSRRASKWANSALIVTISAKGFRFIKFSWTSCWGSLSVSTWLQLSRELEQRAAVMGGGNFVVPVQTVPDFLDEKYSATTLPSSSYRLGLKATNLHELFPVHITEALQHSLSMFDQETRTSSPVQIPWSVDTYECTSLKGLYPIGEGAGYAGGIVSAAVDGMFAGFALAKNLGLYQGSTESVLGKAQNAGVAKY